MLTYSIKNSTLFISTRNSNNERISSEFFKDCFKSNKIYSMKSVNSICISGNISSIGESAFMNIQQIKSIKIIPDVVCSIANNAFSYNQRLTTVEMNDKILSIGPSAFENCPNLTDVTLGESLVIIGHRVFADDRSLKNIRIPHTVDFCSEDAFTGTSIDKTYLENVKRNIQCRNESLYKTTPAGLHYKEVTKYKRGE